MMLLLIVMVCFLQSCDRSMNRLKEKHQITPKEKSRIDRVIAIDDSIGNVRNKQCKNVSMSQAIVNYTGSMKKINMEGTPKQFSKAFTIHIESWEDMLAVTDKYPEMRGEMHDLFLKLEKSNDSLMFKKLKNAIWDTWELTEVSTQ